MSTARTGKQGKTRSPEALQATLIDLTKRTVQAESVLREALTGLRSGKAAHALQVLETYERVRQIRADDRGGTGRTTD